jgi:hypothetical protein
MKRLVLAIATAAFAVIATNAGVAAAGPGPTPDGGLTGACNMTNNNAAFGMFTIAGNHANPNGFDVGMITAIVNSDGGTAPNYCPNPTP